MVKRRQTTNGELRTNSVAMSVQKYNDLEFIRSGAKQYWNIEHIQPFFPSVEKLFKTEGLDVPIEYGIRFDNQISSVLGESQIRLVNGQTVSVHKKISMVLSPFKWMQGIYGRTFGLPSTLEQSTLVHQKIQNPNNSSYVGSIISAALSESGCLHFPKVYGVFTGLSQHHTIDISDDYEELCDRSWFSQNIGKTFDIKLSDSIHASTDFKHTRKARLELQIGEDIVLDGVEELDSVVVSENVDIGDLKTMFKDDEDCDDQSDSSSISTSYIFGVKSCSCVDDQDEQIEDEDMSEESFAWASFSNVPVQVTLIETCVGTLYRLFMENPEQEKQTAWMSQIIFALAYAQRNYAFTHNDLHGNNVMYVPTDKEYLYYICSGTRYRVPTFGYLIKLIDFERGTSSIKIQGMKDPKQFMSDHFSVDEEAGGQYNFEPFYTTKFQPIKPNPSFDLARLATSMFWDIFPEGPNHEEYKSNPVFDMFTRWTNSSEGGSVLFGKDIPNHDRYHGFHLYKAIARFCKDAIPRKEISNLKNLYGVSEIPAGEHICSIEV
jgi:hypothetical protein